MTSRQTSSLNKVFFVVCLFLSKVGWLYHTGVNWKRGEENVSEELGAPGPEHSWHCGDLAPVLCVLTVTPVERCHIDTLEE